MPVYEPAFDELVASLADEVASMNGRPICQTDFGGQKAQPLIAQYAEDDRLEPLGTEILYDEGHVLVEEWLEAQLLDCQSLARRHGFSELSKKIDEALVTLLHETQVPSSSAAGWQVRS
jgi:hypothetical protein